MRPQSYTGWLRGKAHADFQDGVLRLRLPKQETAKTKRIAVKSAK